jgi:threonine/homoserine/homoserine lactone efflux protein
LFLLGLGAAGLTRQRPTRSGWVDVAIGSLMVAFAVGLMVRDRRRPKRESEQEVRRVREGRVVVAFGLGVVMWLPSPTFLAALKQIHDTHSGWALTTLYAGIAVILVLWILEIPIILFLLFREPARAQLSRTNSWVRRHGTALLAWLTGAFGVVVALNGVTKLV